MIQHLAKRALIIVTAYTVVILIAGLWTMTSLVLLSFYNDPNGTFKDTTGQEQLIGEFSEIVVALAIIAAVPTLIAICVAEVRAVRDIRYYALVGLGISFLAVALPVLMTR